jgi:hypothetical protein
MGQLPTSARVTSQVYGWRINSNCVSGTANDCSWHELTVLALHQVRQLLGVNLPRRHADMHTCC